MFLSYGFGHNRTVLLAGSVRPCTNDAFLEALASQHHPTALHSRAVNQIAIEIGKEMALSDEELQDLHWGTLLHDLGKLAIPATLLSKPGVLTPKEFTVIRQHPVIGRQILEKAGYPAQITNVLLYHHERYDGSGYPFGLAGTAIPKLARICAVADAFQAMIGDRSYRPSRCIEDAACEIVNFSATQFDPQVVQAFLRINHGEYSQNSHLKDDTHTGSHL